MSQFPKCKKVSLEDGTEVFYREAGSEDKPVMLLLHGYPTSSNMFRDLIPVIAPYFHIVAPDLPGFGFTETRSDYTFTFSNLTDTVQLFLKKLNIKKFYAYIFDYSSPVTFRLALKDPSAILGLVVQNGNAYDEGLTEEFWAPVKQFWTVSKDNKKAFEAFSKIVEDYSNIIHQYTIGESDTSKIDPSFWELDIAIMKKPNHIQQQVELFYDYRTNVELYPEFQKFLRESDIPVLLTWGKKDFIFALEGAEAFKRDVKKLDINYIDGGHFCLVSNLEEISSKIIDAFGKK